MTTRIGGDVVAESLAALGADIVFGLPGIHALGAWEGLRRAGVRTLVSRTEFSAAMTADGYARTTGRAAPLLLSTGPGALNSLTGLMEAASSHSPVVAIVSQIPRDLVGRRRGYLHELDDQLAIFRPVVKWVGRAQTADAIPDMLAEAYRHALAAPSGPVVLEIPVDVLTGDASSVQVGSLDGTPPAGPLPQADALTRAAAIVSDARQPVIWAGGGVLRSAAWEELVRLAEQLDAPVVTTYMGRGAIPADHPLSVGSGNDEGAVADLLESADVILAVGTELGAETTRQYAFRPQGTIVQIDADPTRFGATYPVVPVHADARLALAALAELLPARPTADGATRAAAARSRIAEGLAKMGRDVELDLLTTIDHAVPRSGVRSYDMTILGYWAAAHQSAPDPRRFLYPLGSGTLGYAWPAALGASIGNPGTPVLAVVGDGGFCYGWAELAVAQQYGINVALLIVDDGTYGILREYQLAAYGHTHEVDLVQPDLVALATSVGVPARTTTPETLADDLSWALDTDGPAVIVLRRRLVAAEVTA
jgi:acetolactate synthase I/II/III large subunit